MDRPFVQTTQGIINLLHVKLIDTDQTGCRILLADNDAPINLVGEEATLFLTIIDRVQLADIGKPPSPPDTTGATIV